MAARDSFSLEPGIFTVSKWAMLAFRMRVSMSAMGSVIVIGRLLPSPAGLGHAGNLAGMHHHPQTDPAQAELAVDGLRAATPTAAGVPAYLELRCALLLLDQSLLRHGLLVLLSERETESSQECPALVVGTCCGCEGDVHASGGIDAVVVDLGTD